MAPEFHYELPAYLMEIENRYADRTQTGF